MVTQRRARRPKVERLPVPPDQPMDSSEKMLAFLMNQRASSFPTLRVRDRRPEPVTGVSEPLVMHHQMRGGLLPFVAKVGGLGHKLDEIHAVYDIIMAQDLRYDLRQGFHFPSGASGALSPFLMNMSMGAKQDTALRYQCEAQVARRALNGRSKTFRDRLTAFSALGLGNYAVEQIMHAWVAAVPFGAMALDNIRPSFGVRHYPDKAPDVSGYFVLESPDPAWGNGAVERALKAMGEDTLWNQISAFDRATFKERGFGILAIDLPADGTLEVKLYKRSEKIGPGQLKRLLASVEAGPEGAELLKRFTDLFVPPYVKKLIGGIGYVLDRGGRPPAFKLYLDTSRMYDDWEAVTRLRTWLTDVGFHQARDVFEQIRAALAPEVSLRGVGNFIDLVSLDVGKAGLFKTTVYYAPEVSLRELALRHRDLLPTWGGALSWDRT